MAKKRYKRKVKRVDKVTKEEILISLVWIAEILSIGILLNKTRYMTPTLIVVIIGLIASLLILNYNK